MIRELFDNFKFIFRLHIETSRGLAIYAGKLIKIGLHLLFLNRRIAILIVWDLTKCLLNACISDAILIQLDDCVYIIVSLYWILSLQISQTNLHHFAFSWFVITYERVFFGFADVWENRLFIFSPLLLCQWCSCKRSHWIRTRLPLFIGRSFCPKHDFLFIMKHFHRWVDELRLRHLLLLGFMFILQNVIYVLLLLFLLPYFNLLYTWWCFHYMAFALWRIGVFRVNYWNASCCVVSVDGWCHFVFDYDIRVLKNWLKFDHGRAFIWIHSFSTFDLFLWISAFVDAALVSLGLHPRIYCRKCLRIITASHRGAGLMQFDSSLFAKYLFWIRIVIQMLLHVVQILVLNGTEPMYGVKTLLYARIRFGSIIQMHFIWFIKLNLPKNLTLLYQLVSLQLLCLLVLVHDVLLREVSIDWCLGTCLQMLHFESLLWNALDLQRRWSLWLRRFCWLFDQISLLGDGRQIIVCAGPFWIYI